MTVGEFIKILAKEKGVSAAKIERDLGFANGYIGKSRDRSFPIDRLELVANYLGVSLEYLSSCGRANDPSRSNGSISASEAELLAILKDLNEAGQQKVFDYAKDLQASGLYLKTAPSGVAETA